MMHRVLRTTCISANSPYQLLLRRLSSRSPSSSICPVEAGRIAESIAVKDISQNHLQNESIATCLAHSGMTSQAINAAMAPPIHFSTTYSRPANGQYNDTDSIYSRADNPTRLLLERVMFELETHNCSIANDEYPSLISESSEPPSSYAFSSGMMAVSSILLAHKSPVTVLLPLDVYHGVPTVAVDVFSRFNVKVERVDMTKASNLRDFIENLHDSSSSEDAEATNQPQIIVWIETPSNPLCQVIDIREVCDTVQTLSSYYKGSITTVVDSTLSPPVLTQPLHLGADLVMHSGTKYLAGHSDSLIGIVTASPYTKRGRELASIIKGVQVSAGGVASPFDSWLTLRGLRTLHVRLERQCQNASVMAEYLESHPSVTSVHYPGLSSHPQHTVATRQTLQQGMFGGVLSFEVIDEAYAMAVAGALRTIQRATSLGGTETLIEHRASIEPPERRTSPPGLLRVSAGLEDPRDLVADLDNALAIAHRVVVEGEGSPPG